MEGLNMHEHDEGPVSTDTASGDEHPHSGGGQRYQQAHRQHAVDHGGASVARAARGTAQTDAARPTSAPNGDAGATTDDTQVQPHPNDESWLKDLGFPKTGDHPEAHPTQVEHGPNAGGSQQGEPTTAESGSSRRRRSGSEDA